MEGGSVWIHYPFRESPWGGGNQFLRGLRSILSARGLLAPSMHNASLVLVNSHQLKRQILKLASWKSKNPNRRVVHRVDGPISLVRGQSSGLKIDRGIHRFSKDLADATVFQSEWSAQENEALGASPHRSQVILNAPDPSLFFPPVDKKSSRTTRVLMASWSPNFKKGFETYEWIAKNIDKQLFDLTFVGRSPTPLSGIRSLPPMASEALADEMRRHDVFLTASRDDPCSNSLIEAIHSGLTPVALDSGGNRELVANRGFLFKNTSDVLEALQNAREKTVPFTPRNGHSLPDLDEVAHQYMDFFERVFRSPQKPIPKIRRQIALESTFMKAGSW